MNLGSLVDSVVIPLRSTSATMYSSRYSYVPKHSPTAQKKMQYHSKGKSCGYYLRIVFFFSSLIQSLIIVSLVLFLIYGDKQDSTSLSRIQDLEERFSQLSIENVELKKQRKNLTTFLNTTLTEKARNDWDLNRLRYYSNISIHFIKDMEKSLQQCNADLSTCRNSLILPGSNPQVQIFSGNCNCGMLVEQMKARIGLLEANFTQTTQKMKREMDQIAKDRDNLNLEAIGLRRGKSMHEREAKLCKERCKTEFVQSLSGISNVTSTFLNKIQSHFSTHMPFQLSCENQREYLDRIQSNCTSLSREVEEKFQHYLNNVGDHVSTIQAENSRLKAENWRLSEDYRSCSQNRSGLFLQHRQNIQRLQEKHDLITERLLLEKKNLNGEITVLNKTVDYKNREVEHLMAQLKQLNVTCMSRTHPSTSYGGSRNLGSNNGWSLFGNSGTGTGTGTSAGGGSSSSSSSSSNSYGQSSRTGSSSSSFYSGGSSSSSGSNNNKPASTGGLLSMFAANPSSSSGSSLNKPAQTGRGSTTNSYGGSSGTNLGYMGLGLDKSPTNSKSSSGSEASSSSSSSTGRSTSRFSWFGSSSSSGSKSGSGTEKGPSAGNGDGGRPVSQHVRELERLVNPVGSLATQ